MEECEICRDDNSGRGGDDVDGTNLGGFLRAVEVAHDVLRRPLPSLQEEVDEQRLDAAGPWMIP